MKPKPIPESDFLWIYQRVPKLCVEVIVSNATGVYFELRNNPPYKGYWSLPGVTLLQRESIEEAVVRVVKRKFVTTPTRTAFSGHIEYFIDEKTHIVSMVFRVWTNNSIRLQNVRPWLKAPGLHIKQQIIFLKNHGFL